MMIQISFDIDFQNYDFTSGFMAIMNTKSASWKYERHGSHGVCDRKKTRCRPGLIFLDFCTISQDIDQNGDLLGMT
jgi:hypothetical protein